MLLINASIILLYMEIFCNVYANEWFEKRGGVKNLALALIVFQVRVPRPIAWSSYAAPVYSNRLQSCGRYSPRDARQQLIIASDAERFPRPSDRPMEAMMRASGLIRETVSDAS